MGSLAGNMFHFICVHDYHRADEHIRSDEGFIKGFDEARKFFDNFEGRVNVSQKTVLDIGCGLGSNCILMAQKGATRVVGIDIVGSTIEFAKLKLMTEYKELSNIVEFRLADDILDEKFDVVISKDSFEHYANPEKFFTSMKDYLKPGGTMVIGFGPLWKAPYGGHITFMTKVPWAHLLFPESVIMQERRRFRNDGAGSFKEVSGGLNKMTLKRY
jgi:SAM-dependent methyltransferase